MIYLKLLNRKLTKTTYDYYTMHRFHIVPFLCVHFSCHKHWYNWDGKTHKWSSIHHFVVVVDSVITRSIHSWNSYCMYLMIFEAYIGEKCRWPKLFSCWLLLVIGLAGYWGSWDRREKYGLMVSVQWWRLNNLIFLTNLLVNFKRFFW